MKSILLSANSKRIYIKAESFLKDFFIVRSLSTKTVTKKKIIFESIPRVIKKIKKMAELNFIDPIFILGIALFKSLSTNLGILAS